MSEAESSDPAPDFPLGLPTLVNCDEDAKTHAWGYFHGRIKQSNPKLDFGRFKNHLQKHPAFQDAFYWDKSRIRQLYTECMEHFSALKDVGKKEVGKSRLVFRHQYTGCTGAGFLFGSAPFAAGSPIEPAV